MKKTKLLVLSSLMLTASAAQAKVKSTVPGILLGGSELKIGGDNLDSDANAFSAKAVNLDGTEVDLPASVNRKADRAKIKIPTVNVDTKAIIKISGGNVASASAQEYLVLILARPDGFTGDEEENTIAEEVELETGSGSLQGPQGEKGEKGDQGSQGPSGNQGPVGQQGPVGPIAVSGGILDVEPLPNFDLRVPVPTVVAGIDGTVDLQQATFFIAQDSNSSSPNNRIIALSGAVSTGHKLSIVFQAKVDVVDANPFSSKLKAPDTPIAGGNIYLVDKLLGRSNLQTFNAGDTLDLIFDGTNWYELSRSTTTLLGSTK